MKPVREWDEEYVLNLPYGEFDWFEVKGRRAIDFTLGTKESEALEMLAKAVSAFANSGGGQIVLGLKNPIGAGGQWFVDDGGIPLTIKGKAETREWLEEIIPNLVDFPLEKFNIYQVLPKSSASQIREGHALFIIDIKDSPNAPHQSRRDQKYYARVGGKSRPISHRLVTDIFNRRRHPTIELSFEIRFLSGIMKFPKGDNPESYVAEFIPQPPLSTLSGDRQESRFRLFIEARNTGRIYAQYVTAFILIPIYLLPENEVRYNKLQDIKEVEGNTYCQYFKDNTVGDYISNDQYGSRRYSPILPGLSFTWIIELNDNFNQIKRDGDNIVWSVHADNALPIEGKIAIQDLSLIEEFDTEFDTD